MSVLEEWDDKASQEKRNEEIISQDSNKVNDGSVFTQQGTAEVKELNKSQ